MSRTKRFLGGMGTGIVSMVVTTVVGIWLAKFLLARWGQHDYGVWLVVGQLLAYLDLVDLGVLGLLGREVAASTGRAGSLEAAHDIAGTVGRTVRVIAWQMPVLVALAVVFGLLLPAEWAETRRPLALVLVAYVVFFPFRVAHVVLDGVQALRDIGLLNLASWALSTVVTIVFTYRGMHVGAAAAGYIARSAFMMGGFVWMLYRGYPKLVPRSLPPVPFAEAREMIKRGSLVTVQKLGGILINASDNLVVDHGLGAAAVVPYACTNKAYTALENLPRILLDAARPGLTELRAGAPPEHVVRVTNALTLAALVSGGLFASVVFAVNKGFVIWWIGEAQWAGHTTSLLLAIALVFRVWIVALHYTSFAFSLDRQLSLTMVLDGVVTIVASLLLVRPLGYVAMPVGSLVGGLVVVLPMLLPAIARDVNVSIFALLRPVAEWAWRFVLCMIAAYLVARAWTPTRFIPLVLTSAGATVVYSLVMLPCVMRSSLGGYLQRAIGRG
jgi:O-antigen/teichoic acid export membrane protein